MPGAAPLTRHHSLDALRGIAVMGILAMNIIAFAMPEWAYITPLAYGGETVADRIVWIISFIFIDGKMRGLFSVLFGASMMLVIARAEAKGESAARIHFSRMFWLAVIGLLHYFLIWSGDILFVYAVIGMLAFRMRHWDPSRLIIWALVIYAIGTMLWILQFGGLQILQLFATLPGADTDLTQQYSEMMASTDFDYNISQELRLHRGGYGVIVADKIAEYYVPFTSALQALAETLPLMLLGMAMQKNGFLTGGWETDRYAYWAKRLVVSGLLLNAVLAGIIVYSGYDKITTLAAFMAYSNVPRLMLIIGYAAGLLLFIRHFAERKWMARIAATGRAAFTNYLGTSIVMTTIFYGYGLGLYGSVSRTGLWLFVFGGWAVMLLWSKRWLARFHYGPFEWVWRSLARGALQPMRK